MQNRIIYSKDDGGVAIVVPAPDCELTLEEVAAQSVPEGKPYRIVDVSDIPTDRTFRAAWTDDGNITVDMGKAKEMAHAKRRFARSAEMAPLDVQATIPVYAVNAEKARQAIRDKYADMQNRIDAAQTVDELKAALG